MKVYENRVLASVCRDSFYHFVKEFWPVVVAEEPVWNWHLQYLCNELQTVAERIFKRKPKLYDLLTNIPPGTSKSTVFSQMFPAWAWTRMPSFRFIGISYAHDVALKDSIKTRDIVQSDKYQQCFPGIILREDENRKGLFTNTQMGYRMAVGVEGSLTGYHGHFLNVDDPLNPLESYSEAERINITRWIASTLPTRKVDKEVTVTSMVMQRLHQADPAGEMIEKSKKENLPLKHICLPGELTELVNPPELRKFYKDGLLDPVRLSRKALGELRANLMEYGYAAQVLQTPIPLGGGMFKIGKFNKVKEAGHWKDIVKKYHITRLVRSWDKAATADSGCYTVGVLMGVDKHGRLWVLDVVRGQWRSVEREEKILETAEEDGEQVVIRVEVEGGSGGKESGEATVRNLHGFFCIAYHPTGEKEVRAQPYSSMVNGGQVFILERNWTQPYLDELEYFPFGKYKDQVDPSADACNYLAKQKKRVGAL